MSGASIFRLCGTTTEKGSTKQALEAAEKINLPGHHWQSAALAAIHAQLGHVEEARTQLVKFVQQAPEISQDPRAKLSKFMASEELVDHLLDGLRKAGLEIEGDVAAEPEAAAVPESRQPFVGREVEYDKLVARLSDLADGAGSQAGGHPLRFPQVSRFFHRICTVFPGDSHFWAAGRRYVPGPPHHREVPRRVQDPRVEPVHGVGLIARAQELVFRDEREREPVSGSQDVVRRIGASLRFRVSPRWSGERLSKSRAPAPAWCAVASTP